jgi:membrane-associated phospholipid phosphatase
VACAAGVLLVWLLAFHVDAVRSADDRWYLKAISLHVRWAYLNENGAKLVRLANPSQFALLVAGVAAIALLRRRPWLAAGALFVTLGASLATQAAKVVLDGSRARFPLPDTEYPSGHMTAAAAIALALVLVVPPRLRIPAALLGLAWTAGVGLSLVATGTHRPSDVIGGVLMAGAFAALAFRPSAPDAPRAPR